MKKAETLLIRLLFCKQTEKSRQLTLLQSVVRQLPAYTCEKYVLSKIILRNSILHAQAHNEGYCVTSDNARRRSKPRRSRGVSETQLRESRDVAEAKPRRSRDKAETKPRRDQSCEHCRESRNFPNCVHWHIFYFM